MIIYKITNNVNHKCYIGQTIRDLGLRIREHKSKAKHRTDSGYAIAKAINKYGAENFSWDVLCVCESLEELDEKERYYISLYDSFGRNGYNLTEGGMKYANFSGKNHPMYGRKHSEESKRKMSEHSKGKNTQPKTQEWKDQVSKSHSKDWQITDPDNNVFVVTNLLKWCEEHNLNRSAIKTSNGTKGYKAIRLN